MPDSFGARLRQRREERQIDLIAISEQTKIKLSLLEALERDDVSQWPSGIFRRAYIRAYAQMIGLDPDVVLREFLDVHPDPGDVYVATAAAAAAAEEQFAKNDPSTRLRTIVDAALGSLTKRRRPVMTERPAPTGPLVPPAISDPVVAAEAEAPLVSQPDPAEKPLSQPIATPRQAPLAVEPAPPVVDEDYEETARVIERMPRELPPAPDGPRPDRAKEEADKARAEQATANAIAAELQARHDSRLETVARLCTEFGRAVERIEVQHLLQESARALTATGLIVWLWDDVVEGLMPALVHGYSDKVLAQLPPVKPDADNATAAAFRDQHACEVAAADHTSGALVIPMLAADGCAGVLAIELQQGVQPSRSLQAIATTIAAAVTQLVQRARPAAQPAPVEKTAPAVAPIAPPVRPMKVRR